MSYTDILEKYKDNKIVCKNKEDGRVILQCMKESDPMLFNAEVLDDIKHVDNFLQPYTELGKQLGMSPAMVTKRINDSCRSFRNPRHRRHISLEVSDSVMEKLINAGYRKTQQIVYDVLYGTHVEGLTEIEHNELCESIAKLTQLDERDLLRISQTLCIRRWAKAQTRRFVNYVIFQSQKSMSKTFNQLYPSRYL